jgi:predicted component of type VI protein secretion system
LPATVYDLNNALSGEWRYSSHSFRRLRIARDDRERHSNFASAKYKRSRFVFFYRPRSRERIDGALKKDKFLIGRAKECSLRAGSEAISRRHCAIIRVKDKWAIRDLGSRNGTYVNDKKIAEPTRIRPGDEVRVGPLRFRVETVAAVKPAEPAPPAEPVATPAAPAEKPRKQPPVKDVADVVERTISKSIDGTSEDDISRWLLGLADTNGEAALNETTSIRLEETKAHGRVPVTVDATVAETVDISAESPLDDDAAAPDGEAEAAAEEGKSGGWSLFKRGKGAAKKKPGKLPPRTDQATKDSREAAADILREMTRRR